MLGCFYNFFNELNILNKFYQNVFYAYIDDELKSIDKKMINKWMKNGHALNISHVAENGKTATPTSRSATARETMNRLVTERNLELQKTAAMTRQLPTMTITLMAARTDNDAKSEGSLQVTSSSKAAHAVAFSVSRIAAFDTRSQLHHFTSWWSTLYLSFHHC